MYLRQISRRLLPATLLAAALAIGATHALPAQQSSDSTRVTTVRPATDSAATLTPWRNYVSASDTAAASQATASRPARTAGTPQSTDSNGNTTFVFSTVGLLLVVIILVLLLK